MLNAWRGKELHSREDGRRIWGIRDRSDSRQGIAILRVDMDLARLFASLGSPGRGVRVIRATLKRSEAELGGVLRRFT